MGDDEDDFDALEMAKAIPLAAITFFGFDLAAAFLPLVFALVSSALLKDDSIAKIMTGGEVCLIASSLSIYTLEKVLKLRKDHLHQQVMLAACSIFYLSTSVFVFALKGSAVSDATIAVYSIINLLGSLVCSIATIFLVAEAE